MHTIEEIPTFFRSLEANVELLPEILVSHVGQVPDVAPSRGAGDEH